MTDINHRRRNRPPVDRRYDGNAYHNGYPRQEDENGDVSRGSGYLDKSLHGWGDKAPISNKRFGASIPNDFTDGHRGMARAVSGAKKFVRSRVRFHENAETRRLASEADE